MSHHAEDFKPVRTVEPAHDEWVILKRWLRRRGVQPAEVMALVKAAQASGKIVRRENWDETQQLSLFDRMVD